MNGKEKSLRWVANQIPDFNAKTNEEKMLLAIKRYCTAGADEIERLEKENALKRTAFRLAIEKMRFCPYPPETVYNPDSECEEQVSNCDFGDDRAECEECIMRYFLQQADKIEEERK